MTSPEEMPLWRVLYLFAGPERHADIRFFLQDMAADKGAVLEMHEWDILRDPSHDLTSDHNWQTVLDKIKSGYFDFLVAAPPCNTFSRARHNRKHMGPKPLRSIDYVRGFPWLKDSDRSKTQQANLLVERTFEACGAGHLVGTAFLVEHPEQLGIASGLIPASIWDWPEFSGLGQATSLFQGALFQCMWGAPTSKPTRLATTALESEELHRLLSFQGPHQLDSEGQYRGPLPQHCPHRQHEQKLIGKSEDGSWRTSPSAAYPAPLCEQIAKVIATHISGHVHKGVVAPSNKAKKTPPVVEEPGSEKEEVGQQFFHGRLEQAARDNSGLPLTCRWQNRPKSFMDGGGLNSPGRWEPTNRGSHLDSERRAFTDKMALLIRKFVVEKIPDLPKATFTLATGHMVAPPFSGADLEALRLEWFKLLGGASILGEVTPNQPFYLHALAETLRRMGDEDVEILTETPGDNYVSGRKVGVGGPIPPAPLVFRPRPKVKKYDESSYQPFSTNYPSADEARDIIARQFSEEEALGWMYPLSEAEAKRRFGDRLRVASLAAIPKDESTVRVIFDGTHGVQVNNEIVIQDRLEFPTPSELATVMEVAQERDWGVVLGFAADIMKAHRRFLHAEEDHGLLGCKADSSSKVIWINRVGTFGVACAALHFGRLAGAVFRMVIRVLRNQPCFQLLFADDLKLVVGGPSKHVDLWTLLVGWLLVGTPFSWKKFRGGLELDYVGFWTDYGRFQLGLSEKRAQWVIKVIDEVEAADYLVSGRAFTELLGRLGFSSQAVPWIRPLLGPMYVWDSVMSPHMTARIPLLVALTLKVIRQRFRERDYTAACWSPKVVAGESFRTDAKCETGRIVLAGWECGSDISASRWFSCEVLADDAPWLYYRGADVQKMSTAAEMLASYMALHAFGFIGKGQNQKQDRGVALVAAGTDNLANEQLARKRMTTKLPLGLVVLQFYTKIWDNSLWVDLRWRPRDTNVEADQLTNGDFKGFDEKRRVQIQYRDLDVNLIELLQKTLAVFEETATEFREKVRGQKGMSKRQKLETKSAW